MVDREMLGRKRNLDAAMEAYQGKYDKQMLKHIYFNLKQEYTGPLIIDVSRGVKFSGEWLLRIDNSKTNNFDQFKLLPVHEVLKIADYTLAYAMTIPSDVYQLFGMYHTGDNTCRYLRNISKFCFGAYVAKVHNENMETTIIIDKLMQVLNTKHNSISRASATQMADRALRYFGFIVKSGLDNLFSLHYTLERVTKCNGNDYKELIANAQNIGRGLFNEYYQVLPESNIFRCFISDALIEYEFVTNQQDAGTNGQNLKVPNKRVPKKKPPKKCTKKNK
jgi:hypothetical protein